jgi:hypothetical protein
LSAAGVSPRAGCATRGGAADCPARIDIHVI